MLLILESDERRLRLSADCLPDALLPAQEAQIVNALRMVFRLALNQSIAGPESAIPVPDRVMEGMTSAANTDSDV
jgi:hypothetical protein